MAAKTRKEWDYPTTDMHPQEAAVHGAYKTRMVAITNAKGEVVDEKAAQEAEEIRDRELGKAFKAEAEPNENKEPPKL